MTEIQTLSDMSAAAQMQGQFLGGGTLVMRDVNYTPQNVPKLVRITDPAFRQITRAGRQIVIGAGVTMAQIIKTQELSALAPAARSIGGPAIRNMATLGGNLFAPHPYGDFTVALLALGAEIRWADGRVEPIETFLANRDSARGLVAAILLEPPRSDALRFKKISRTKPKGVSVLSIAANLKMSGSQIQTARIAFGAMGPTPLRAKQAEQALAGARLDAAGIARACASCTADLAPMEDALASAWYRAEVAPIYLRRLLLGET